MIAELKSPETVPGTKNPYKFLDYFTESPEDRRRFGGRDREIHDLVTRITNERTLVLYGPSGIGKTSLLLAGVFPALRERGYRPVYARLLTSPVEDLRQAVVAALGTGEEKGTDPGGSLRDALARATQAGPVALVLDQLEELFIRFKDQPKERAAFASALATVVNDRTLDLTVVFSLREDYLANLDELGARLPDLLAERYRLPPLTAFGVRQAVSRPLVDAGVAFEPAVISRLIVQLAEVDCEPSLLQILCSELYKAALRRAGGGVPRITVADLESLGGSVGVFRRYLQSVADELPQERHLLARMVLDSLITPEGTKRAARLADILISGFSAPESEVREILDWLVSHRLLRHEERSGEAWYELVHERLVPLLRDWLDSDPRFFEFRQARILVSNFSDSELWRESPDTLLSAEALTNLLHPYRECFRFSTRELEFVVRSAIYRQSDELSFWVEQRYCPVLTRSLLLNLLGSGRDMERLGAAVSARRLADPEGELAHACLNTALQDSSERVRWEAGLSLAKLARPEDVQALVSARVKSDQRERAGVALAALAAGGHDLAGVCWFDRWLAKHRNRKWAIKDQRQVINNRTWLGIWSGVIAGLIWALVRLMVHVASGCPSTGHDCQGIQWPPTLDWCSHWLVLGLEFVLIGMLTGGLTARTAARRAVILKQEGGWVRAMVRNLGYLGVWLALAAFAGLAIVGKAGWTDERTRVWVLCLWPALSLIPVMVAQISRPFVGLGSSPAGTWLGSLVISLGWPVVVALGVLKGVQYIERNFQQVQAENLVLNGREGMAVASMAFFAFVISVALIRSTARYPVAEALMPPSKKRFPAAATLVALVIVLVVVKVQAGDNFYEGVKNLAWQEPVIVSELKDLAGCLWSLVSGGSCTASSTKTGKAMPKSSPRKAEARRRESSSGSADSTMNLFLDRAGEIHSRCRA
ncbi:MAG TPA: hypothetical protein VF173_28000 [Thermoanaerobaculia bacterium]|nr:hypothetical protein [Thermoanaerobaculia bacterium]